MNWKQQAEKCQELITHLVYEAGGLNVQRASSLVEPPVEAPGEPPGEGFKQLPRQRHTDKPRNLRTARFEGVVKPAKQSTKPESNSSVGHCGREAGGWVGGQWAGTWWSCIDQAQRLSRLMAFVSRLPEILSFCSISGIRVLRRKNIPMCACEPVTAPSTAAVTTI